MPLPFGEYLPDLPAFQNPGALEALNVIPAINSYRPFPAFTAISNALTARAQGAIVVVALDRSTMQFTGDATKLYRLISTSPTTWSDVSRTVGGAYATATDGGWSFCQFGQYVIACNGVDANQVFNTSGGTNFAALAASSPIARYTAPGREFVFLANLASFQNRVQWSPINNPLGTWGTDATTQADYQDLPDGGEVTGITGGEYVLAFQKEGIHRFTYQGPPLVWRRDKISNKLGCALPGSLAQYGDRVFFADSTGFYQIGGGQQITPIGNNKVDSTFWADLDRSFDYRVVAAVDPVNKLYIVLYPGAGSSGGTPNKMLVYSWGSDRWARVENALDFIYSGISQSSYTLDGLDAVSSSLDALPFSLDSGVWSGVGRLLLAGFDTTFKSGYFNGAAMAATIDTTEIQPGTPNRSLVRTVRPLVDGGTVTVASVSRNRQPDTPTIGSDMSMTTDGIVPVNKDARYHRFRTKVAAGGTWTHAIGVDEVAFTPTGMR